MLLTVAVGIVNADNSVSASVNNSVNTEYVICTQKCGEGQIISKWDKYKTVINNSRRKSIN